MMPMCSDVAGVSEPVSFRAPQLRGGRGYLLRLNAFQDDCPGADEGIDVYRPDPSAGETLEWGLISRVVATRACSPSDRRPQRDCRDRIGPWAVQILVKHRLTNYVCVPNLTPSAVTVAKAIPR